MSLVRDMIDKKAQLKHMAFVSRYIRKHGEWPLDLTHGTGKTKPGDYFYIPPNPEACKRCYEPSKDCEGCPAKNK